MTIHTKKTLRSIINKVIVLFPDYSEPILQIQNEEIIGVGILPSDRFFESSGFANFKESTFSGLYEEDIL